MGAREIEIIPKVRQQGLAKADLRQENYDYFDFTVRMMLLALCLECIGSSCRDIKLRWEKQERG